MMRPMAVSGHRSRSTLVELKRRNEWDVIEALRDSALTRPQLIAATGLSRSTVANVVVELQRRGLVDEHQRPAEARVGPGRFGAIVTLRSSAGVAVGVAIDRDSIRVAALDLNARVLAERTEPIPPATDGVTIIANCADMIRAITTQTGIPLQRVIGV